VKTRYFEVSSLINPDSRKGKYPKKRPGRPKVIKDELQRVTLWLPVSAISKIDELVAANPRLFRDRSEFIRDVVMAAAGRPTNDLVEEKLGFLAREVPAKISPSEEITPVGSAGYSALVLKEIAQMSGSAPGAYPGLSEEFLRHATQEEQKQVFDYAGQKLTQAIGGLSKRAANQKSNVQQNVGPRGKVKHAKPT
jgi:hypothetical protein